MNESLSPFDTVLYLSAVPHWLQRTFCWQFQRDHTTIICSYYHSLQVPQWLHINKPLTPDFVVADPKRAPVWEIIGAEFSKAEIHTADGISIRFPRIQKIRDDKTWKEATDLPMLKVWLYSLCVHILCECYSEFRDFNQFCFSKKIWTFSVCFI